METDPVCGMRIDPAKAAGTSEYNAKTYYFCSDHCKKQLDKDPQKHGDKNETPERYRQ